MKESIFRLTTDSERKQRCVKVDYIKFADSEEFTEFSSSPYDMEYFEEGELPLEDGEYPAAMFEQVIVAAPVIRHGDPTPIITYRGMMLKEAFRKYREK